MNACLILMSSAIVAGSDCGGCAVAAPSCDSCSKVTLLDKIKARVSSLGRKSCGGCDSAPSCAPACAPAPTCHTACKPACGTPLFSGSLLARFKKSDCGCDPCAKPSLLDRLKAKFHRSCDSGCSSGCDTGCSSGCGAAPMVAPQMTPMTPPVQQTPQKMPNPPEKKIEGKTTQRIAPSTITPVGGSNPF